MSRLFIALMLAVAPSWAISLTTFDIDWTVTEVATSNVLCSGSASTAIMTTVCAGAIPGWDGIELFASAQAIADVPHFFSESNAGITQAVLDPLDQPLYDIQASIRVISLASSLVVVQGGIGDILIFATGGSGSGGSIGASFGAGSDINGLDCFFGCPSFQIGTGTAFFMHAESFAEIIADNHIGVPLVATAAADVGIGAIFNPDGTPRQGTTVQLVPEPETWAMLLTGLLMVAWRTRQSCHS